VKTGLMADERFREHLMGRTGHPERPERYDAVMNALDVSGLRADMTPIASREASEEDPRWPEARGRGG